MSGYEDASLTEIEAVLDGLEEATSSQVYYATKGYQARAVAAVAASRADAAGGASFPPEWTVGEFGELTIMPSEGAVKSLEVAQATGASGDTFIAFNVDNDGAIILAADGQIELRNAAGNDVVIIDPDDHLLLGIGSGLQVTANGYTKIIGFGAEPPDGDLNGGEMILWFDRTDGAAKLMVKAKQQDGTVRTGAVNLT